MFYGPFFNTGIQVIFNKLIFLQQYESLIRIYASYMTKKITTEYYIAYIHLCMCVK